MSDVLVVSAAEVRSLLPPHDCVELMADVLVALQRGELYQPLRSVVAPPAARGLLGLMPAHRAGDAPLFALKAVAVFPENPASGLDAHQGAVVLFDGSNGRVSALVDASAITEIRTAAVSGVATRALARAGSRTLAILGAGVQARSHLDAMDVVLDLERVRIWSRTRSRLDAFRDWAAPRVSCEVCVAAGPEAALADADVVVTATASAEPVLERAWLAAGAHVNAVGSSIPTTRELDSETMAASRLFVDRRESTLNESGDYLMAAADGLVDPSHICAELGEVLTGDAPGRTGDDELTVFKSLGLAVEDLAAAEHVAARARAEGVGTEVTL